jgi:hypothetical protein
VDIYLGSDVDTSTLQYTKDQMGNFSLVLPFLNSVGSL